ncbi:MAG TPA: menaquinol-cytochrome c reductase cytochrome b subunit [Acidimicrobiia bacterium]
MTEIPEHLLQRSRERRKALGLPVPGEEGEEAAPAEAPAEAAAPAEGAEPAATPAAPPAAPAPAGGGLPPIGDVELPGGGRIPAHLLQRSRDRRIALGLEVPGAPAGAGAPAAGAVPAAAPAAGAATATATLLAPTVTGPGGHTQRLLTVVKSGSIQETRAEAQDKVHTWPHLLVVEFASLLIVTAGLLLMSAAVRAPLLQLADFNKTPNPSKAPWYFLGLQELLTMFHPMVAGVTIPGMALFVLGVAPFVDKNPSHLPKDRKFAIAIFTIFVMMWAVLVIIGSFFRGPGFNFVFPWNDGIFFEL